MPQKFICTLIAVLGLSACDSARSPERAMLLSIDGVRLESAQAVYFIGLNMQNLRVRAFCNVPTGWTLATGIEGGQGLIVEGQASAGIYQIKSASLNELKALLLVEEQAAGGGYAIDGELYLDVDGRGPDGTIIPLNSNIVLQPAERCPAPMH